MIKTPKTSCVKQPLNLGSSETTREASLLNFSDYQTFGKPEQISRNDSDFWAWFIGFCEGDGSFIQTKNRVILIINQADPQLLHKIRTKLGFGNILKYTESGRVYHRFSVSSRDNVLRLIHLFNGNIILDKVYLRFLSWVERANQLWNFGISVKPTRPEFTLNNSWLSGFIEADGGFNARVRSYKRAALRYRLDIKFYITQQGEAATLLGIIDLLESKSKVQNIFQNSRVYNRIEITSLLSLSILIKYLDRYPCKGKKAVLIKQ